MVKHCSRFYRALVHPFVFQIQTTGPYLSKGKFPQYTGRIFTYIKLWKTAKHSGFQYKNTEDIIEGYLMASEVFTHLQILEAEAAFRLKDNVMKSGAS